MKPKYLSRFAGVALTGFLLSGGRCSSRTVSMSDGRLGNQLRRSLYLQC
jgi:hypothetical protein